MIILARLAFPVRLEIRLAGKINSGGVGGGGVWQKTWSLNVPNKGLQKQSQTLLSTVDWQQQMDFCSKHFPTGKGAAMYRQPTHDFYSTWPAEWGQQEGSVRMERAGERGAEAGPRCRWDDWFNEEKTWMSQWYWWKEFLNVDWRLDTKAELGKGPVRSPELL